MKELGNDEEADIFFAVESFLENVTSVAVRGKFDDSTPVRR